MVYAAEGSGTPETLGLLYLEKKLISLDVGIITEVLILPKKGESENITFTICVWYCWPSFFFILTILSKILFTVTLESKWQDLARD